MGVLLRRARSRLRVEMATWIVADDRLDDYTACAQTSGCDAAGACFSELDKTQVDICEGWF